MSQARDPVSRLREICLAIEGVTERLSHGEPAWFTASKKMFAMLDDHHHGAPHLSVWLAAEPGAQQGLVDSDPGRFFVPPYVGTRGWVGVVLDGRPGWSRVEQLVMDAHGFIGRRTPRGVRR